MPKNTTKERTTSMADMPNFVPGSPQERLFMEGYNAGVNKGEAVASGLSPQQEIRARAFHAVSIALAPLVANLAEQGLDPELAEAALREAAAHAAAWIEHGDEATT